MIEPSRQVRLAQALVFIAPALWAANYIVARAAVGVIEPHLLALLRWLMALALMLPLALPELIREWPRWRREWRDMLLLGALGMWVCGAILYMAGRTTESVNIALYYALSPVLVALASAPMFGERLHLPQWTGLVCALAGGLIIIARGSLQRLFSIDLTIGDFWALLAMCSWVTYSLLLRQQSTVLGPFSRLTMITAGGVVVLIPLTLVEVTATGFPQDWPHALMLCLVVAVLPGFGAYQAFSYMQHHLGPARAGVVLYLNPLYTAMLAWWVLGEAPYWYHAVGALLILPGIYLATRR